MKVLFILTSLMVYSCGLMDQSIEKSEYNKGSEDVELSEELTSDEAADFALWSFGNVDPEGILAKYDTDEDGKLSEEERVTAKEAMIAECYSDDDGKLSGEEKQTCFMKKYDKDGDGKLSEEEQTELHAAHKKSREARWKSLREKFEKMRVERFDTNQDGVISNDEKKTRMDALKAGPKNSVDLAAQLKAFCEKLQKTIGSREKAPLLEMLYKSKCETKEPKVEEKVEDKD